MKRHLLWAVVVITLIGVAWSVGRAQGTVADFELTVDAPGGTIVVACRRGCDWKPLLTNIKDQATGKVIPGSAGPNATFFACSAERCQGRITGRGFINR